MNIELTRPKTTPQKSTQDAEQFDAKITEIDPRLKNDHYLKSLKKRENERKLKMHTKKNVYTHKTLRKSEKSDEKVENDGPKYALSDVVQCVTGPGGSFFKRSETTHITSRMRMESESQELREKLVESLYRIPQFQERELESTMEALTECGINVSNVTKMWDESTTRKKLESMWEKLRENSLQEIARNCKENWKRSRNLMFFVVVKTVMEANQMTIERFKELLQNYIVFMESETVIMERSEEITKVPILFRFILMHPVYWPEITGVQSTRHERKFSKGRIRIFGQETVEYARLLGTYPSLEENLKEENYVKVIEEVLSEKWKRNHELAEEQGVTGVTGNFLWDIVIQEMKTSTSIKLEMVLDDIECDQGKLRMIEHVYDHNMEGKLWKRSDLGLNDMRLEIKHLQMREEARRTNILNKITPFRMKNTFYRTMEIDFAKLLMDEIRTGRNIRQDLKWKEAEREEVLRDCAKQWRYDRNYTILVNLKARVKLLGLEFLPTMNALKDYKKLFEETEIPNQSDELEGAPYDAAILLTHPSLWPSLNEEERRREEEDQEIRRMIEQFGRPLMEIFKTYGKKLYWNDSVEDKGLAAIEIQEEVNKRMNEVIGKLNIHENVEYVLWYMISENIFQDNPIIEVINKIYNEIRELPGIIVVDIGAEIPVEEESPQSSPETIRESQQEEEGDEETFIHRNHEGEQQPNDDGDENHGEEEDNNEEEDIDIAEERVEDIIKKILKTNDVNQAKRLINRMRERYNGEEIEDLTLNSTTTDLLKSLNGQYWPKPQGNACPYTGECEEVSNTAGLLRNHMYKRHNLDVDRVRDEMHATIEYMMKKEIRNIVIKRSGEWVPMTVDGKTGRKPPIYCHFCGFQHERDDAMESHLKSKHRIQHEEKNKIGMFWTVLRYIKQKKEHTPCIIEALGEFEGLRCTICGCIRNKADDISQHIQKAHKVRDRDVVEEVRCTYVTEESSREEDQQGEEHEQEEEEQREQEVRMIEPEIIHADEESIQVLDELRITEGVIRDMIRSGDKRVFNMMLKLVLKENKEVLAAFIERMKNCKEERRIEEIKLKDDMDDFLWNINSEEWPMLTKSKWCPMCNIYFESEEDRIKHRRMHGSRIEDIASERDYVRMNIEETNLIAISTTKRYQIGQQVHRCKTPGCGYCFMKMEEWRRHEEKMLNSEDHIKHNQLVEEYGEFYGTLKFLVEKLGRIPSIKEYLGENERLINVCSTCYQLLPMKNELVKKHYEREKHRGKRGEWSFKAKIIEVSNEENVIQTHMEEIMKGDRRMLNDVIREMEARIRREHIAQEDEETEEERQIDVRAIRVAGQRMEEENRRMHEEAEWLSQARAQGIPDAVAMQQFEERRRNQENQAEQEERVEIQENEEEQDHVQDQVDVQEEPDQSESEESTVDDEDSIEEVNTETEREEAAQRRREQREQREMNDIERLERIRRLREERDEHDQREEEDRGRRDNRKWRTAKEWREKGLNDEKKGYSMPKMDREARKQVKEGLRELWSGEIKDLIDNYDPEIDNDEQWLGFEGALYHMEDLLRRHIMIKLGRRPQNVFKRKFTEHINQEAQERIAEDNRMKRGYKVANMIEKLNKAIEEEDETRKRRLEVKLSARISELSEAERRKWWGTDDSHEIMQEIEAQAQNTEAYARWMESTLIEETKAITKKRNESMSARRLQEQYSDNAGKTMKNLIWKEEKPQCRIEMKRMEKHVTESCRQTEELQEDESFRVMRAIQEDLNQEVYEYMTNLENIEKAIKTRNWNSAAGVDGLDYTVYKEGGREAAKVIRKIIKIVLKNKRAPVQFKSSRTVFVYKKGDEDNPRNWRPLSISNAMYRIFTVIMSRYVMDLNKRHCVINEAQKGFMEGMNGTVENILTVMELFHDAQRSNKSLYITAMDFQNAFGSVNHEYMVNVLRSKGMPEDFTRIVEDIYTGSNTRLEMMEGMSQQIDIKKGMKQGCPLSPLLFNLSLDPLIRDLENRKEWGYKIGDDSFTVQGYADDIILISRSEEGMNNLIKRVEAFTKISGMKLAPEKCVAYVYGFNAAQRRYYTADIRIGEEKIKVAKKQEAIRYLGAPITARKTERMKENKITEADFMKMLAKIMESQLTITQKIHAIKTFLLPKLEYEMTTNQFKIKTLEHMERAIRSGFNKIFGAKIPKAVYHGSVKDGGMGIPSVKIRQDVAVIRGLLNLVTSKHMKVKRLIRKAIKDERKKRRIEENEEGGFFKWNVKEKEDLKGTKGTSSIAARACKSCLKMGIQMNEAEELRNAVIELKKEDRTVKVSNAKQAREMILQLVREMWKDELKKNTFHLHTFQYLIENKNSNAFIDRLDTPAKDSFVRFAIKARTNTLPTKEFVEIMRGRNHTGCSRCHKQVNESLQHILNGCPANRRMIMDRHDSIVKYIADNVKKKRGDYVALDSQVNQVDIVENRNMKPDIQIWNSDRSKVLLIEVNSPYAKKWEGRDSLEEKYNIKRDKYEDLVKELEARGVETKLSVIVVSSLGVLYKESEREIYGLITDKRKARRVCRVVSSLAILGSAKIWWRRVRGNGAGMRQGNVNQNEQESGDEEEENAQEREVEEEDGEERDMEQESEEDIDIEDMEEWARENGEAEENEEEEDDQENDGEYDEEEEETEESDVLQMNEDSDEDEDINRFMVDMGLIEQQQE